MILRSAKILLAFGLMLGFQTLYPIRAAAADVKPSRFVQLCDTQLGMGGYEADKARFRAAVEAINALAVDWVVICGDLVNDGDDDNAVADFRAIMRDFTMPCYLAPGNHDVGGEPTAASLARYRALHGKDYFAVEQSGFKLMILNTQLWKAPLENETERHDTWYRESLAEASAAGMPVVLISHYPPFLDHVDEEETYYNLPIETRKSVLDAAVKHGARAWLAGHAHKNILAEYEGMPVVVSATTSKNFDGAPYGFRVWSVDGKGVLTHRYEALALPEELMKPE